MIAAVPFGIFVIAMNEAGFFEHSKNSIKILWGGIRKFDRWEGKESRVDLEPLDQQTTFSVVLGNLLENAIDGCKTVKNGEKKLKVRGKAAAGFVYLEIANTFGSTVRKNKSGDYLTTKAHGQGMGLRSVAQLVKLHQGEMDIDHQDGMFQVSVMLQEQKQ